MATARRFLHKLWNFLSPSRAEKDLAKEIEAHLQLLEDEFQRRGLTPDQARSAAKRVYGGIDQAKELHRDARSWLWLEQMRQDIRHSIRALANNPGFTLITILTLALGIGANSAIFGLIDAVMLRSLPVSHPQQLIQINLAKPDIWGVEEPYVSNPVWEQLRDRQDIFSGLFGYAVARFNVAERGESRYVQGNYVSGQFFETLGLLPVLGRTITTRDDHRGCPGIAMLGFDFWQSEYGGRADVEGSSISLDNHRFEIAGVIRPGFTGVDVGRKSDIYVPLCSERIIAGENNSLDDKGGAWLRIIGRPNSGLGMAQIDARLKTLATPIFQATLPTNATTRQQRIYLKRTFAVQPASTGLSTIRAKYRQSLVVLMVIVSVVLLIACSNVANLLLARGATRQREIAIRLALGSSRGRLFRQFVVESLLLSLAGAVWGILFAHWGERLLVKLLASNVYHERQVELNLSMDARVLLFTVGVAVLTALLFGIAPALRAIRLDPQLAMRANAHRLRREGRFALGKALVVAQIALSLILVAGAGLLLATFTHLETMDAGFDRAHVLLIDVDLGDKIPAARRSAIFAQMLEHLRASPGVRSVSRSSVTPLGGAVDAFNLQVEGYVSPGDEQELVFSNEVSDNYFETLGTRLLSGRDFNLHDVVGSPKVAIINESFAHKYFHGKDPIGRHYRAFHDNKLGDPVEIVGVVHDTKYLDLREDFHPAVYVAASQDEKPWKIVTFELRTAAGNTGATIQGAKRVISSVNPDAFLEFRTLAAQVHGSLARERLLASLSGFFGALALLLAVIGLYGVTSYNVSRRRSEIGICMALGAGQSRIVFSVLKEVVLLISMGLLIGLAATSGVTRLISSLLYGVTATDASTLSLTATILASAATLAGLLPALRASRLDPMKTLREE